MKWPIPANAERITLNGDTAWMWPTEVGWSIVQGIYRIDQENVERDGKTWHTIDWYNQSPRQAAFEGGLARYGPGHISRPEFLTYAEPLIAALRRRDAPPTPPTP